MTFSALRIPQKAEGGGGRNSEMAQQQEERRRAIEEQKEGILAQILTQDARERRTFHPMFQIFTFDIPNPLYVR